MMNSILPNLNTLYLVTCTVSLISGAIFLCWLAIFSGASWIKSETSLLHLQKAGNDKERANHSTLAGSRFYKQVSILMRFVLRGCKISSPSHSAHQILKIYIETLTGFSHIWSRWARYHFSISRLCPGTTYEQEKGKQNAHSKNGGRGREPPTNQVQL